jgi:predicted oxidoreductase
VFQALSLKHWTHNLIMELLPIGSAPFQASRLAYGCWRIAGWDGCPTPEIEAAGRQAVTAAYEAGYTLFDNADIYGRGHAERIFGQALREIPEMRDRILIASKCGIRVKDNPPGETTARWDFSADYIIQSAEGILKRIGIETLDILMLHRPDILADPQEIALAFSQLQQSGKVRYFGVSNFRPTLLSAVQAACPMPLIVHQVEISLAHTDAFLDGTLDQCLASRLTPMAWSPLGGGLLGDGPVRILAAQKEYKIDSILAELCPMAAEMGVSQTALALAWLLKHPARIQPIIGSTNPARIREAVSATRINLSRSQWYRLWVAAQGAPLP